MVSQSAPGERRSIGKEFGIFLLCLIPILLFVFRKGLEPNQVLFANDAPLGVLMSQADEAAQAFTGYWTPNNWLGIEQPSALPTFTATLFLVINDPVLFAKWYAPLSLLFSALCTWYCFRKLGFHAAVCVIGAIAALLNMNSLSNAAWGLPVRAISLGLGMLAVAALHGTLRGWWVLKAMLAGACVALSIMEGFDVGALYSLWLGAFAFYTGWLRPGTTGARILRGAAQLAVVALFAVVVSAAALQTLIGTQIVGVAGM
ncbi:MAG TPA: hypothetical protein VEH27_10470, partial [Methylomirabilota bacterium]|nr:hypothetical protein [Methylomirabilota bacterium]